MNAKRNCIVAQSGGPTVAINASLAGVIQQSINTSAFDIVYGARNGITGICDDRIIDLTALATQDASFISTLKISPSMYLGSCRYKLPSIDFPSDIYKKIFQYLEDHQIKTFFYIGGNDSMDTVSKLSEYAKMIQSDIQFIGIPKTIDNDLCNTDHTPGFGSAAKYIATSVLEVAHDAYIYHVKSVTIVEIMGRDAGWLTAASALARNENQAAPHLIYLPEKAFDIKKCIADVNALLEKQDNVIIAISEGIHDKDGNYISASTAAVDHFGHNQLSGAGKALENILKDALSVKVRSIEVNVLQRCASHCASLTDLGESMQCGQTAVELSQKGQSGIMVTMKRDNNQPYHISYAASPINDVANQVRNVPDSYINEAGNDVTEKMMEYLRPLILGEPDIPYVNGLPKYLNVKTSL